MIARPFVASIGLVPVVVALFAASSSALGQRLPTADAPAKPVSSTTNVRAELAAVLLQSKKYDDAAREYRALLARDASNTEYRLGLARALAWGDRPREAEVELRTLRAKGMRAPSVDSLLRTVRDAMEPRAAEAASWVAEERDYAPYRLAYARALAREHYNWIASAQYDTLVAAVGEGTIPPPTVLRREQAHVLVDAGDLGGGAARLRAILDAAPADTAIRHELVDVLLTARRRVEARTQLDTLIIRAPTAGLFIERARLRLELGDRAGAQYDLVASFDYGAKASAYVTLGNLYRDRGDYDAAKMAYRSALERTLSDSERRALRSSIAELSRDQRPVAAFVPSVGDDPGFRASTEGVSDNLGFHYVASTVGGGVPLGAATFGISAVHQYIAERSALRSIDLNTYGATASLSGQVEYGSFLGRIGVTGGSVRPPGASPITVGRGAVAAWLDAWELAVDASTGPAYSSLLTTTSLRPLNGAQDDVLTERDLDAAIGGPLGSADVALSAQRSSLSDGNTRSTLQAYFRHPLSPAVFVVYQGNRIAFAERSTRYWDPLDYVAHAVGLEVATRPVRGLAWALRALPGMAWSSEIPQPAVVDGRLQRRSTQVVDRSAFQLSSSGELAWRGPRWESGAAVSYGIGRVGDYRRLNVTLGVRVVP